MSKTDLKLVEIPKYGLWNSSQNVRLFEDIWEVFLSYLFPCETNHRCRCPVSHGRHGPTSTCSNCDAGQLGTTGHYKETKWDIRTTATLFWKACHLWKHSGFSSLLSEVKSIKYFLVTFGSHDSPFSTMSRKGLGLTLLGQLTTVILESDAKTKGAASACTRPK